MMGFISQFTLKKAKNACPEINSWQALNLFQGLTNGKIPKQVRNDIIAVLRAYLV